MSRERPTIERDDRYGWRINLGGVVYLWNLITGVGKILGWKALADRLRNDGIPREIADEWANEATGEIDTNDPVVNKESNVRGVDDQPPSVTRASVRSSIRIF